MGEYYDGVWNVGTNYSVWKDRINVVAALYDNRFLSVGIYFRAVSYTHLDVYKRQRFHTEYDY